MIPHTPSKDCGQTGKTNHGDGRYSILVNAGKGADKDCDRADMLDDQGGISYQRPEIVRAMLWVELKVV